VLDGLPPAPGGGDDGCCATATPVIDVITAIPAADTNVRILVMIPSLRSKRCIRPAASLAPRGRQRRSSHGTRLEESLGVQIGNPDVPLASELDYLRSLHLQLRTAIREALTYGRPELAVSLDTARESLETLLADEHPKSTRVGLARARAEISLEVWREACSILH
jgi:hypothetical protein